MSVESATVRLRFPAKAEYLILARLAVAGIARSVRIGPDELADLKLAVTEACGNAVRHAYGSEGGSVRVVLEVESNQISVCVEDEGEGLAAEPGGQDWAAADLPERGMGLAIIRAVADDVSIGADAQGHGTTVRFTKRF